MRLARLWLFSLHEDVIGRIAAIGEAVVAQGETIARHEEILTSLSTGMVTLSIKIDSVRDDSREMFEQVLSRLDGSRTPSKRKRR